MHKGIKTKNLKKQINLALLAKGRREAEGLQNEGEVIDLNKLINMDDQFEDQMAGMNIEEENKAAKTKKKKEVGMDLDLDFSLKNKKTDLNFRKRQNKKKKSSFIIKF